ncbi:hypothetical protein FOPG_19803 [Fusarium oxysporum f. sp. conglutinans race 2 54008]|uniref:Major facilitator superfamily (MFS) profile domain-containing protein n=2 Tax=Fusarium oxysporum f. sp. conglutinans TaxID=100902 RepID=X0GVI2_FUSOX|nr:hypothetical protein FOPG_19803 [Fusarium oxysporum f. sp. conglutinans race 2 54008]KAG7001554.1 MFS-type transporter EF102 [Fusarium oxysporum f. sp. conglutinans]KAI8396560.1 hypothetical protein FOFC_21108 [Fusarium oxysporum]
MLDGVSSEVKPKVYKRGYFGLLQVFLLNLCSSIAWVDMSSVVDFAAEYFRTSVPAINWFSTSFLLVALLANYPASLAAHRGLKFSMLVCSAIMIVGTWLMYGGTYIRSFGLSLFGHSVIAIAQPFAIILPAPYSEAWFRSGSRATATAISGLATILGGAVGQYIMSAWIQSTNEVVQGILYQSILLSAICSITVFVPSKPLTSPSLVEKQATTVPVLQELKILATTVELYLIAIPFGLLTGSFNTLSFLIFQICTPYGFTTDQCVNAGLLLVVPGLIASLIAGRLADKFRCHVILLKGLMLLMGASFLAFAWVPTSGSVGFLYGICTTLSIGTIAPAPVSLEFITEILYPLSPELAVAILWAMGQLLGGILTIGCGYMADDNGGLQPAVYLLVALALACPLFTLSLGLWGRHSFVQLRRSEAEDIREN